MLCCDTNMHDRLEEIGLSAGKEYSLEKQLRKMKGEWAEIGFTIIPYRDEVRWKSALCVCSI